jgi:putative transposase
MPRYSRAFIPGGTFFFTVATLERRRGLLTANIDLLRQSFTSVRSEKPFTIEAIVVLPDHLHCIWTLPPDDADFSSRWHAIKARFSRGITRGERLSERRVAKGERGIWQRRFWEHAIRDERDFERHADYIHFNPVKHGYAQTPAEWEYSSFRRFVDAGYYPPDWAAGEDVREMDFE